MRAGDLRHTPFLWTQDRHIRVRIKIQTACCMGDLFCCSITASIVDGFAMSDFMFRPLGHRTNIGRETCSDLFFVVDEKVRLTDPLAFIHAVSSLALFRLRRARRDSR